jgi:4-amino-4-deoxy-L-arabinose transferase-like glycosyltransferase
MAEATMSAETKVAPPPAVHRRRPPAALTALIAASLLLGLVWALVSPPFQAPDENAHFGYVQTLVENGALPGDPKRPGFSTEQLAAGDRSNSDQAAASTITRMEWGRTAYERWLASDRDPRATPRDDGGGANPASSNPPLYYAVEALAYQAAHGSDLFGRLSAMRLLSLLWLGVTVTAAWLLAGEALGRDRLAQLAAAGLAGLAPMMSVVSASVSPDAMLFASWTVALWLGVRVLRRGLTAGGGAALFAAVGVAIVVKAASYALLPGALLVLVVGLRRHGAPRTGLRPLAAALAGLLVTAGAWFAVARALGRPAAAQVTGASSSAAVDVRELLSYVWQFYLPRLPFMTDFPTVAHTIPVYDVWIKGAWGAFGWTEVVFRDPVYVLLAALMMLVIVGAAMQLWRTRAGGDRAVFAFLAVVALSLLAGLHWSEYHIIKSGAGNFNQGRYLLPLVGIAGVVLALALRRLPARRRAPAVATVLAGLLVLQALSLGLVLERFYA